MSSDRPVKKLEVNEEIPTADSSREEGIDIDWPLKIDDRVNVHS